MDRQEQLSEALSLLRETGMTRSSYAPPLHRLVWRWGIPARPPHFATFTTNTLNTALWFGPLWGALMWFFVWSRQDYPLWLMAGASLVAGLLFGLLMAFFYRVNARKNRLPAWEDIPLMDDTPWLDRHEEE